MSVLLAEVVRGDLVESAHHGALVAVDPAGTVLLAAGEVRAPMYPRSAVKPVQALGMLRAGLDIDGELLALACASHAGEPFHLAGVRRILAAAGLTPADLQNTPGLPLDEQARAGYGEVPTSLAGNCSGKHAAMLATCVAAGWDTADYRDPKHPMQLRIRDTLSELSGEPVALTTVDGCGAPLYAISLLGLATAFGALVNSGEPRARRIVAAMTGNPQWVDGTVRSNTAMMRALPGAIVKGGAEGVLALAVPGGPALAVKITDGAKRPLDPVAVAALEQLGVTNPALRALGTAAVLGHGEPVGRIRPVPIA